MKLYSMEKKSVEAYISESMKLYIIQSHTNPSLTSTLMSQIVTVFVIFSLVPFFCLRSISSKPSGFSLKLIRTDSPISPSHFGISNSRAFYLQQSGQIGMYYSSKSSVNATIRLKLKFDRPLFTVELGIGTPPVKVILLFDTGSDVTWIQCKPCEMCFKQTTPLFDVKKSVSYRKMTTSNKFAKEFKCNAFGCFYNVKYHGGAFTSGNVSLEEFYFQSTKETYYKASGLVFGCGTKNKGVFGSSGTVSGILGMNKKPASLARQLGRQIKARFSYCLPTIESKTKESYIRFGDEAVIRGTNIQSSPFMKFAPNSHYILNLTDISINGKRLRLKQSAFPKGCIIDSGSSVSLIQVKAFSAVKESLKKYFSKFKILKRIYGSTASPGGFLCYSYPRGFTGFPNMTFHFQGADLEIPPQNIFKVEINFFCLEMYGSKVMTLLGAYQQQNTRFVYDLDKEKLLFARQDCSKDAI